MTEFWGKGKVGVIKTQPETVLGDIGWLLHAIAYTQALPKDRDTILVITAPLPAWCPGAATTPWQLEGVVRCLKADGYNRLFVVCHQPLIGSVLRAEEANKLNYVIDKYHLSHLDLHDPEIEWIPYKASTPLRVLDRIFPNGIPVPKPLVGRNIIHLPTLAPHPTIGIAGSLLSTAQLWLSPQWPMQHAPLADLLTDALVLQHELSAGSLTLLDGTLSGYGTDVFTMHLREWSLLLASTDHVAVDTLGALLQGHHPYHLEVLQQAQKRGLGTADLAALTLRGENILSPAWNLPAEENGSSDSRGKYMLSQLAQGQSRTFLPTFLMTLGFSLLWSPLVGNHLANAALRTPWGQCFQSYADGSISLPQLHRSALIGALSLSGIAALLFLLGSLRKRNTHPTDC